MIFIIPPHLKRILTNKFTLTPRITVFNEVPKTGKEAV